MGETSREFQHCCVATCVPADALLPKMKAAVLLSLLGLALASPARDSPNCWCGAFIEESDSVHQVFHLESAFLSDCSAIADCKAICAYEFNQFTSGGDLDHVLGNGYTVGQEICLHMLEHDEKPDVTNAIVYGYANLCNGPWVYDGVSSTSRLCCRGGFYQPC